MGNCVTADAVSPTNSIRIDKSKSILSTQSQNNTLTISTEDKEWNDTIRVVFLIMLDRLADYLEHENILFATFASTYRSLPIPSQSNGARAIDIFSNNLLQKFETYLNTTYIIDSSKLVLPDVTPSDLSYPQLQLKNWIAHAQSAQLRTVNTSCHTVGTQIIDMCKQLQTELNTIGQAIQSYNTNIAAQCEFFAQLFTFATKTDILKEPKTLYQNIDVVCSASA